ncbi:MAG: RluA family pseudouridine synthase [Burkholderiaceae bacterium]|jgi:23S rRNA pseudouridine1911/1915/1917 synthase|nr:RluA family pseudouridine synthase [Aquabacterium sp.]NUP86617.1 RluA family pseudouridine synthase [Burkholderiaceae bacterium]
MVLTPQAGHVPDIVEPEIGEPGEAAPERRESLIGPLGHGQRLDKWLVQLVPEFSRSYLQTLVERGHVRVDGAPSSTASRKLRAGQLLQVDLVPTAQSLAFTPQAMPLAIVHEDEHILVVDKPAGLVVHPAAGNWSGTLLNGLLAHHGGAAMLPRAGIVHRLDKDTSGLMVVAKSLEAMTSLVRAIASREVRRVYLALCHGEPSWAHQVIEAPIGRDPISRVRMAVVPGGKPARTDIECLARNEAVSAMRCRLHTGRTHQIRVHLSHLGFPLVADATYGGALALGMTRQALHAAELGLDHPVSGAAMAWRSPLPADMAAAWARVAPEPDAKPPIGHGNVVPRSRPSPRRGPVGSKPR